LLTLKEKGWVRVEVLGSFKQKFGADSLITLFITANIRSVDAEPCCKLLL
jgi:hypothetical protein